MYASVMSQLTRRCLQGQNVTRASRLFYSWTFFSEASDMRLLTFFTLAWLCAVSFSADEAVFETEDDVTILNSGNFEQALALNKYLLIEFYAPWCGHCKSLKPEYAKAATKLKSMDPSVTLAMVDATVERELSSKFGLQGFPTLKWFVDGTLVPDAEINERESSGIIQWCKRRSRPPAPILTESSKLSALSSAHRFLSVGFFISEDSEEHRAFVAAAAADVRREYAAVTDAAIAAAQGVTPPAIVFYRSFDEPRIVYTGPFDTESIAAAVAERSVPTVYDIDAETMQELFAREGTKALLFWPDAAARAAFARVAAEARFRANFTFAAAGAAAEQTLRDYMNVGVTDTGPVLTILDQGNNAKYRYDPPPPAAADAADGAALDDAAIARFLEDFSGGRLRPFLRSQPVALGSDVGRVKTIVGSQFHEFTNQDKHVVIQFYAPWCGHCKRLEPQYKAVADYFDQRHPGQIVFGRIDGSANEAPDSTGRPVSIEGFPTVWLYPRGKKTPPYPYDFTQRVQSVRDFVRAVRLGTGLAAPRRGGEEEYEAAAARFKAAVRALPGALLPAAERLARAAEELEVLAAAAAAVAAAAVDDGVQAQAAGVATDAAPAAAEEGTDSAAAAAAAAAAAEKKKSEL